MIKFWFGQTSLSRVRRGFMPPQLKINFWYIFYGSIQGLLYSWMKSSILTREENKDKEFILNSRLFFIGVALLFIEN